MGTSFEYELRAIRARLVRLLEVFNGLSKCTVPAEEWHHLSTLSYLHWLSRPFWMEKFNALISLYHSLQKEFSLALSSALVEPVSAHGESSTYIHIDVL
jgi:hypothetical protein